MKQLAIIQNHGFTVPLPPFIQKWKGQTLFIPTWLLFIMTAMCVVISIAAIKIEPDNTLIIETVRTVEAPAGEPQKITYFEYVIAGDTLLMSEDSDSAFIRKAKKAIETETESVNRIIEKLESLGVNRNRKEILVQVREQTREQLQTEIPQMYVDRFAPVIGFETKDITISNPKTETKPKTEKPNPKPKTDDNKAQSFSNLGFVLNPNYAKRHNVDPAIVAEKKRILDAYIARFAPVAVLEMNKYGIPASITLAQALLESNAGESRLAVDANNHFGIKCFSKSCSKGHCKNYTDDTHKDFFKMYSGEDAILQSYRDHSLFLQKPRYKHLLKIGTKDYKAWSHGLKKAGYATDKRYAYKLISIIDALELHKYDR